MGSLMDDLFDLIYRKSFKEAPEPTFKLASGVMSRFYFNAKPLLFDQLGARVVARWVLGQIVELTPRPTAIGGLEIGAIPIACTVQALAEPADFPMKAFVVRKEAKAHGTKRQVEGELVAGERVVVVDDVITSGESTLKAIHAVEDIGCEVQAVYCLVDRPEGEHSPGFRPYEPRLKAAFTLKQFLDRVHARHDARAR